MMGDWLKVFHLSDRCCVDRDFCRRGGIAARLDSAGDWDSRFTLSCIVKNSDLRSKFELVLYLYMNIICTTSKTHKTPL